MCHRGSDALEVRVTAAEVRGQAARQGSRPAERYQDAVIQEVLYEAVSILLARLRVLKVPGVAPRVCVVAEVDCRSFA